MIECLSEILREKETTVLPANNDTVLKIIFQHAASAPDIEVGGILVSDGEEGLSIIRFEGSKTSIYMPLPATQTLVRSRKGFNWRDYILYHSHPSGKLENSYDDRRIFARTNLMLRMFLAHQLRSELIPAGRYYSYSYVVCANGDWSVTGVEFLLGFKT